MSINDIRRQSASDYRRRLLERKAQHEKWSSFRKGQVETIKKDIFSKINK